MRLRLFVFFIGLTLLSLGIAMTVRVQHLGLHPWDVLSVAFYNHFGLSIGSWNILIGLFLTSFTLLIDRSYVKVGTIVNLLLVGVLVDGFLWLDFLPTVTNSYLDVITILVGISIMGIGGGLYNAVHLGAGPRDGFMLALSDLTGYSIRAVRIGTESFVLILGFLIGGPVFLFSFIFTFIQSPIFQFTYLRTVRFFQRRTLLKRERKTEEY